MPRLTPAELANFETHGDSSLLTIEAGPRSRPAAGSRAAAPFRPRVRRNENAPFRCGSCRVFVGQTVSGGRHRNHCPFCLASRHVDLRRPGDRESPCRAMMPAVGVAFRADGEQMLVHRCNGCGAERQNRIAADDDPAAVMRLAPVSLPYGKTVRTAGMEEEATIPA
ncbi:MAG: RNHCP domain-containing protein [Thermomicrobiales bacterium]